eukprot:jgi/Ulvmu1/48/UM001_0051.1
MDSAWNRAIPSAAGEIVSKIKAPYVQSETVCMPGEVAPTAAVLRQLLMNDSSTFAVSTVAVTMQGTCTVHGRLRMAAFVVGVCPFMVFLTFRRARNACCLVASTQP